MAFFSRVFLPFLLLTYISVETYLKLQDTSLCAAEGCKLAGELLRFDAMYLNYFGIVSMFVLLGLGYLSLQSKLMERLFLMLLYSAIAFETTILSYQFFANPEPCLFCLTIFSTLIAIALFSRFKSFAFVVAVVLSIFVGLNTLAIVKNKAYVSAEGLYLIQSETCVHCKQVKKYFAEQNIAYTPISVNEVNARSFLKFVDISTIPVLVLKEKSGTTLLTGDKKIIAHFSEKKETVPSLTEELPQSSSSLGVPTDLFSATSEPGCAITIVETAPCEDDNTTRTPQH